MADWSDTPPTEPGWYWLKQHDEPHREIVAQFRRDRTWNIDGMVEDWDDAVVGTIWQYGPRALSPAELLAMRQQIATLTAERDAAEAELEAATQRLIDQEVA